MMLLSPGGEVGGGVAIPVHHQPAAVAAKEPIGQPQLLLDEPAARAGPGRGQPAVGGQHLPTAPRLLVAQLTAQLGPAGVADRAGQLLVADEVGDGEALQA
jgi:hypothetical protein